jgi:uncharacterized CHY-type Zn-finger protein
MKSLFCEKCNLNIQVDKGEKIKHCPLCQGKLNKAKKVKLI